MQSSTHFLNNYISYTLFGGLALLIGLASVFHLVSLSLIVLFGLLGLFVWLCLKPNRIVYIFIIYIILQNFVAILLSSYANGILAQGIILVKDIVVYIALVIALVFNRKSYKLIYPDLFGLLYLLFLTVYLIAVGDISFFVKLVQFRQLATPVILYFLGRFLFLSESRIKTFLRFLVYVSIIAVLFGLLERYILGDEFWINIGIQAFLSSKGMDVWAYGIGGLPGNFYSYDFYSITGFPLRRMVSFIADPTLFGQFLVFPIMILLFLNIFSPKLKKIFIVILLIGLALTLSKGGMVSLTLAVIYKVLHSKYRAIGYALLIVFCISIILILSNATIFSSLPAHLNGLFHNVQLALNNPFGLGLGKAGNLSMLLSKEAAGVGESYIGMMIAQVGIFFVIFVLFILSLLRLYNKTGLIQKIHLKSLYDIIPATLTGIIFSSLVSESAISFISAGIFFLMAGIITTHLIKFGNIEGSLDGTSNDI